LTRAETELVLRFGITASGIGHKVKSVNPSRMLFIEQYKAPNALGEIIVSQFPRSTFWLARFDLICVEEAIPAFTQKVLVVFTPEHFVRLCAQGSPG